MPREKKVTKKTPKRQEDSKLLAFITTFLSLVGFILAILFWRKDKYVMHYAKISLVVFIIAIIAGVINSIVGWIPILGWIIVAVLNILVFLAWLFSWIYALSGDKKEIRYVSKYAKKIKL